ncbi:hypothetical protein [Nocardia sp. A7]|uniref:hypothetical protein n=1 Tax=Nocardia sp. A7 TaxID=2789274 RepID=UPI00397BFBF8
MTNAAWQPLGAIDDPDKRFEGLYQDVPAWLDVSLWDWIYARFTRITGTTRMPITRLNIDLLRQAERVCKFSSGFTGDATKVSSACQCLKHAITSSKDKLAVWRLVDFLLSTGVGAPAENKLETILLEAGSAWTVGMRLEKVGLEQRVPVGVKEAAERVAAQSGNAGTRLAQAWAAAYGVQPDPANAYSLAIKAVEDAVIPEVEPNNAKATLGTSIGQVIADGDWKMPMLREHANHPTHEVLIGMLRALWTGQHDRHGGTGLPPVGQEEAEAAVILAVALVDLFVTKKARRAP